MKNNWKKVKLSDVCDITSSKRIFMSEYTSKGIPFYRSKEIIEKAKGHKISTELFITNEKYNEIKNKFSVPKEKDLLLTSVGTLGIPYIVKPNEKFYFKDGNLTWFKNYKNVIPKFLYYFFVSSIGKNAISSIEIGSTQKAITIENLKNIEFNLPPLETQQKIAKVLSAFDDKIELNNKMNENLEQQAQAIFNKYFPNINISNNFIGNYIKVKRGKNLLSKDAILGKVPVVAGGLQPATYHNKSNTDAPVITISASGANAGYINLWHIPVWSSDSSFIDNSVSENVYFWFVLLKNRQQEIYDSQTGSAQPHIYPQHIENLQISDLDKKLVDEYNKKVTPLFKLIGENKEENKVLEILRDTLLPKLMNGEIDVDKIKI